MAPSWFSAKLYNICVANGIKYVINVVMTNFNVLTRDACVVPTIYVSYITYLIRNLKSISNVVNIAMIIFNNS